MDLQKIIKHHLACTIHCFTRLTFNLQMYNFPQLRATSSMQGKDSKIK